MRISELEGANIALWGWGREGRAAYAALRRRLPGQPMTVLCGGDEAASVSALADPGVSVESDITPERLAGFDIVIKSPGISPYRSPAAEALALGARFTSGTALWFAENPEARTLCITGSKGKSTASALAAHLLRAAGLRTALAGNIGLPLLELLDAEPAADAWVFELSSFQTGQAWRPDVAVVLNLFAEHLDWHGSDVRYFADKLALITHCQPGVAVLNAADARLAALNTEGRDIAWFNRADGWHLRGELLYRGDHEVLDLTPLPLSGRHNRINVCAALSAVEALGIDALTLAPEVMRFAPLPNRLQRLGERDGVTFINDSIATTPESSIAALDSLADQRVAIILGGYERGVDWQRFVERVGQRAPALSITQGQNGPRIHDLLMPLAGQGRLHLVQAEGIEQAVEIGRAALAGGGVLLLSPGAPSFPRYRDYVERGRHFAQLCGFDPDEISAIPGLGIA
ncbi:MAG: UDP-N-acetylmuramoyl-L-alanine--D-glutamate ligase [Xanthomonadaceae bacterium]|nr:UDP-N-acetylmuramoyl-L-alanine--D-glutamate ligase [Xanthomonadaceae bacterium]